MSCHLRRRKENASLDLIDLFGQENISTWQIVEPLSVTLFGFRLKETFNIRFTLFTINKLFPSKYVAMI